MQTSDRLSHVVAALGAFVVASAAGTVGSSVSVDLGQAPSGTVDTFEVEARNASCDEPQDFRFASRETPWLKLVNGSSVKRVERGKAKTFVAEIDLRGLKPGRYRGQLDVACETCGDFVLYRCHIDTKSIAIAIEIVADGPRKGPNGTGVRTSSE